MIHTNESSEPRRQIWRWALWGSLGFNLFMVGVLAAPLLGRSPAGGMPPPPPFGGLRNPGHDGPPLGAPPGPPPPELMIERMADELPAADAALLRAIYAEERGPAQRNMEMVHESFRQLAKIMEMEKPDLKEMEATLSGLKDASQQMHDRMAQALRKVATELP
ncbi:MAG: periplasmic heavy metal sensor [Alphaproteobacteria bacterium]|nr:periplasmic heavy metal sensor [Alphaproteobacteria bacterium]